MELKKIKDRIQKLLAMSNDLSSPNEAAIASVRVQKLMVKYNLEMADLIAEELMDGENIIKGEGSCRYKRTPAYIQWINVAISKAFNCETRREWRLINGQKHEVSVFYGYKTDVDIAISMNDYICNQLERMVKIVKIPETYRERGMGRRYWRTGEKVQQKRYMIVFSSFMEKMNKAARYQQHRQGNHYQS